MNIKWGLAFLAEREIKIYKEQFRSDYLFYIDNVKPYKYQLTDTAFTDNLALLSKFQSLTLDQPPSFTPGQQLTGYLAKLFNFLSAMH